MRTVKIDVNLDVCGFFYESGDPKYRFETITEGD